MRGSRLRAVSALLCVLILVGLAPASVSAAGTTWFGAKLTRNTQPTGKPRCDQDANVRPGATCTWVAVQAFENGGHQKAPRSGTIHKVRLVSCAAGSFVLQVARKQSSGNKFKVVKNVKTIKYAKDTQAGGCGGPGENNYKVQSFSVSFSITKGDYIAVKAPAIGFIHQASSGDSKVFDPPLAPGGGYRSADSGDNSMLIQFVY